MTTASADLIGLTAQITSAHCANNTVEAEALPGLIHRIYQALASVKEPAEVVVEKPVPAVPPKRSVFPDYIVCLEDGKKLKMLKRHLQTTGPGGTFPRTTQWRDPDTRRGAACWRSRSASDVKVKR